MGVCVGYVGGGVRRKIGCRVMKEVCEEVLVRGYLKLENLIYMGL